MPTSMTPDWLMFSLVLHKMWSINELEDNEISVGLVEFHWGMKALTEVHFQ
jgi:hypothetical protein